MIIFSAITLRRGTHVLLEQANATVNSGQKVGLVGKNGTGKSTLLSLIKGECSTDNGTLQMPKEWRISSVSQETPALEKSALAYVIDGDILYRSLEWQLQQANAANDGQRIAYIHGELDNHDAWTITARAASLLHGLGFSNNALGQAVSSFSGGWRMRLNLAKALLCPSDLLLLDEPTNHLDLDAIIWLEKWLKNYSGTLILISHDRDFLDPIVTRIIAIKQHKLEEYTGNYSSFEEQRAVKLLHHQALYLHQQQKMAHLQHFVDRFRAKASKAKQAQSRVKMLERMQKIAPAHLDNPFHFHFSAADNLPNPLLRMVDVVAGYEDKIILEKIKFNLVPGSRIGLLGRNGAGKSTLIKLLAGTLAPLGGNIELSKGVQPGYFAQHQLETLCSGENALWHLAHIAPQQTEAQLRHFLGGFGFSNDKVFQPVKQFSGGEKARLVLALIVWNKPNLLLLDEPTNHLDLDMRQALTEALIQFDGALIVVSHDRHLLRMVTDEFYLVDTKRVEPFTGDLSDYQNWLQTSKENDGSEIDASQIRQSSQHKDRKQIKRAEAQIRARLLPLQNQIKDTEKQLDKLNQELMLLEQELSKPDLYTDENKEKLADILIKKRQVKRLCHQQEEYWYEATERLEAAFDLALKE